MNFMGCLEVDSGVAAIGDDLAVDTFTVSEFSDDAPAETSLNQELGTLAGCGLKIGVVSGRDLVEKVVEFGDSHGDSGEWFIWPAEVLSIFVV